MNPWSSTIMFDLVWDINSHVIMCDQSGARAKPLCQSHGEVFPMLLRLFASVRVQFFAAERVQISCLPIIRQLSC